MLKNHFGNLRNKADETKMYEKKIKKKIFNEICISNKEERGLLYSKILVRFNPFLSSIMLKVTFIYFKAFSSNFNRFNYYLEIFLREQEKLERKKLLVPLNDSDNLNSAGNLIPQEKLNAENGNYNKRNLPRFSQFSVNQISIQRSHSQLENSDNINSRVQENEVNRQIFSGQVEGVNDLQGSSQINQNVNEILRRQNTFNTLFSRQETNKEEIEYNENIKIIEGSLTRKASHLLENIETGENIIQLNPQENKDISIKEELKEDKEEEEKEGSKLKSVKRKDKRENNNRL